MDCTVSSRILRPRFPEVRRRGAVGGVSELDPRQRTSGRWAKATPVVKTRMHEGRGRLGGQWADSLPGAEADAVRAAIGEGGLGAIGSGSFPSSSSL